jgi:hypothetical protein
MTSYQGPSVSKIHEPQTTHSHHVTGKLDTLSSLSPAGKLELKVNTMPLSLTFPHACPLSYTYTHTHTHTHTHTQREREREKERERVCVCLS